MSDSTIDCPRCGSSVQAGGRFCMNCGYILEAPAEQTPADDDTAMQEATEPGMPGESAAMSADASEPDEGAATLSGSIGSAPDESMTEASSAPDPDPSEETGIETQAETAAPAPPESWYAELSASPGGDVSSPHDSSMAEGDNTAEPAAQIEPEERPTYEAAPEASPDSASSVSSTAATMGTEQGTAYTPPTPSSGWQPGTYDMGGTEPGDISMADQVPPAPTYGAAPSQTQSIFSPPPPPTPQGQGQYTQPISPQQGYTPPSQAPQQGYTPPPAYSGQSLPPPGTQPLQPGQSYPNYPQYQQGYPPQQAAAPKDPTTALMLELLGFLGFLGIGHIYAGKTNRGIALLIAWLVYLTASFVLTICLIGCFMFIAWLIVPPLSGIWVKNEMEKERMSGFRP